MKNLHRNQRILYAATGVLVLSIILMIAVIPGILTDTKPNANPVGAATGVSLAIIVHLLIFFGYMRIIKVNRRGSKKRDWTYIGIAVLLLFFGLIYMDGAFAFLDHKDILYVSILMFTSVLCDFVASIMTIIVFFLMPRKAN